MNLTNRAHCLRLAAFFAFIFFVLPVKGEAPALVWYNDMQPNAGGSLPTGSSFYLRSVRTGNFMSDKNIVDENHATLFTYDASTYLVSNGKGLNCPQGGNTLPQMQANSWTTLSVAFVTDHYAIRKTSKGKTWYLVNTAGNSIDSQESAEANSLWYCISANQYLNHIALKKYFYANEAAKEMYANGLVPSSYYTQISAYIDMAEFVSNCNTLAWLQDGSHTAAINDATARIDKWMNDMASTWTWTPDEFVAGDTYYLHNRSTNEFLQEDNQIVADVTHATAFTFEATTPGRIQYNSNQYISIAVDKNIVSANWGATGTNWGVAGEASTGYTLLCATPRYYLSVAKDANGSTPAYVTGADANSRWDFYSMAQVNQYAQYMQAYITIKSHSTEIPTDTELHGKIESILQDWTAGASTNISSEQLLELKKAAVVTQQYVVVKEKVVELETKGADTEYLQDIITSIESGEATENLDNALDHIEEALEKINTEQPSVGTLTMGYGMLYSHNDDGSAYQLKTASAYTAVWTSQTQVTFTKIADGIIPNGQCALIYDATIAEAAIDAITVDPAANIKGTYTRVKTNVAATADFSGNSLYASTGDSGTDRYVLGRNKTTNRMAFCKYTAAIPAGGVYLQLPAAQQAPAYINIAFEEEEESITTEILFLPLEDVVIDGQVYTIMGIPVAGEPTTTGVYVRNGKKFLVK